MWKAMAWISQAVEAPSWERLPDESLLSSVSPYLAA
jgi:hypothetical protein